MHLDRETAKSLVIKKPLKEINFIFHFRSKQIYAWMTSRKRVIWCVYNLDSVVYLGDVVA